MIKFQLIGDSYDIKIIRTFTKEGWDIFERDGTYYLSTPYLDLTKITTNYLKNEANEYLKMLNGIVKVFSSEHINISLGDLCEFKKDGKIMLSMEMKDSIRGRGSLTGNLGVNGKSGNNESEMEKYRKIAENNINIFDALHFFQEINWWNLYKIYEIIGKDLGGGEEEVIKFWGVKKDIKRFTGTSNNRHILGDEARHAKEFQIPKNPMKLEEAYELFRNIFKKWIESKNTHSIKK